MGVSTAATGAASFRRGFSLIATPGLRRFVIAPLAINTALFIAALDTLRRQFAKLLSALNDSAFMQWLAGVEALAWLVGAVQGLLWLVFGLGVVIAVFYVFSLVANLIAAPLNGVLAEQVERHLRGQKTSPVVASWVAAVRALPRTLLSELRKFAYLLLWTLPLLVLTFIPGLNLLSTFAWLLFGAWLMALEYLDYPMGNQGHTFTSVRKTLRAHRGAALGFGGCAALAHSIPLLNLIAMPAAVAGATALWVSTIDNTTPERHP